MGKHSERTADDVVEGLNPAPGGPAPKEPFAPTTPGTSDAPEDETEGLARKPREHGVGGFPEAGSIEPGVADAKTSGE